VGGFGIDGGMSTLVGASLANPDKLYYLVIGDLAFFYDMNCLGNRHVGKNLRILLVNNGRGTEFRQYDHHTSHFGDDADDYIAAAGHFGNKSRDLVKHYATSLGFEYYQSEDKQSVSKVLDDFTDSQHRDKSIIYEVFTDSREESKALEVIMHIQKDQAVHAKSSLKNAIKSVLGENTLRQLKNLK
jgi:2-succinyl-5-enolpyruvyl-6-hydroxy-3-cyclohexene-1-carboxylate synthase